MGIELMRDLIVLCLRGGTEESKPFGEEFFVKESFEIIHDPVFTVSCPLRMIVRIPGWNQMGPTGILTPERITC